MTAGPAQWDRVKQIFQAALNLAPADRAAFITVACAADVALLTEVESLLAAHLEAGEFAERPALADVDHSMEAPRGETAYRLQPGDRVGSYQIVDCLGVGGMGEVYRARDLTLRREVAIKVLPERLSLDPDRLKRFQREAELLAALNHPNIAHVYGLEEAFLSPASTTAFPATEPGRTVIRALVLELVEGLTLADRLTKGPLPLDEACRIAGQLCEALEAAHDRGVVHRDLKPANIKIRPDGVVKVLDFGLAKATVDRAQAGDLTRLPAATMSGTREGTIFGTVAYMSPEQARGQRVDQRTDIWALGCVVFEMLTGQRTFAGPDVTDTIAAVLRDEPDWSALPSNTPAAMRRLLRRALAKEPRNRLADAAMVRLEIEEVTTRRDGEAAATIPRVPRVRRRERTAWLLVAVSALAVATLAVPAMRHVRGPVGTEPVRFRVDTPPLRNSLAVSVSPDGRLVAFVADAPGGQYMLYLRPMDSLSARPLAGTEDAFQAFWSPDSRTLGVQIGFGPNARLKRVDVTGGSPQDVARCGNGAWNRQGTIICVDGGGLSRVSAFGGALTRMTSPEMALEETGHLFPQFLPDDRHFLYLAWSGKRENRAIYVGDLDSDRRTRVLAVESEAVYVPPGLLVFARGTTLFAQAFDATRLVFQGDPVAIADGVVSNFGGGNGAFAVSTSTLAYESSLATIQQLAWLDRQGRHLENVGPPGLLGSIALSPDEKRLAFTRREPDAPATDVWTLEMSTGIPSRLTTDPAQESEPVWSPTGQSVLFASNRTGNYSVFQRDVGSREDVLVFASKEGNRWPHDWSRDGRYILINDENANILKLPITGDRTPILVLKSHANVDNAHFSPDGRWVAYASTETGRAEIFIASFPQFGKVKRVSAGGGNDPQWRRDGRELFYITGDGQLMAVSVADTGAALDTTAPKKLFETHINTGTPGGTKYAVSADGQRFLVVSPAQDGPPPITVILNWMSKLKPAE